MTAQTLSQAHAPSKAELPAYHSILLALDSSDHAGRGQGDAIALAELWGARITGTHVYAAKLHDARFRQMEGGLPEQFRMEQELERQREVHDDLITRGLSIITDSYLDQAERACRHAGINFVRRSLEGKNYRELTREANGGQYDLLVMGALGLGAVQGSRLGTVCQRVARRSAIDTLIVKEPGRALSEGPIVVGVDGSPRSYGGLLTALALAQRWQVPVTVVAAFDPYYHYVAFNRIAGVLSEEAGKVFKFKEQEKLHEEIIDSGLARIYQGHLDVAASIAREHGTEVETVLLDGKPHDAIAKYVRKTKPSLLVLGKLGIHADAELDIGGNAEQLLHDVDCAVLLSQRQHTPSVDLLASVTTSWTTEAEQRMERVPEFVRPMARMAILRYAQEQGHTVITARLVEEATARLMPGHAEKAMGEIVAAHDAGELKRKDDDFVMRWSDEASALLRSVEDLALRGNLSMRAEKKARQDGSATVQREHIAAFLDEGLRTEGQGLSDQQSPVNTQSSAPSPQSSALSSLHWQAAAKARLMRAPEGFMREASRQRIEDYARGQGLGTISLEVAEAGLAEARKAMEQAMQKQAAPAAEDSPQPASSGGCPYAALWRPDAPQEAEAGPPWSADAEARIAQLPVGLSRTMTRRAVSAIAAERGVAQIDAAFVKQILETFQIGSAQSGEHMPWDEAARAGIRGAPDMVRGMLIKEIEGFARRKGLERIDGQTVETVKALWQERGVFHLDPQDPRH